MEFLVGFGFCFFRFAVLCRKSDRVGQTCKKDSMSLTCPKMSYL